MFRRASGRRLTIVRFVPAIQRPASRRRFTTVGSSPSAKRPVALRRGAFSRQPTSSLQWRTIHQPPEDLCAIQRLSQELKAMASSSTADEGVRYRNKVVIVTGGSRGIGGACVELFVRHGSKVVIADIMEDVGKELESSLNSSGLPGRALFVKCDISKQDDIQKLIQSTIDKFGQIDCVINNAAFFLPAHTLDTLALDDFRKILDVNILGAFLMSKFAIKYLRESKGNIINITSMSAVHGQNQAMAYACTKSGLVSMTQNIAIDEAKNGVRVNCVSPAGVDTKMFQTGFDKTVNPPKFREYYTKHSQYMGRLCQPVEVAKACLYLATDATYSTGQNIFVSGGTELDYGFKSNMEWYFQK